MSIEGKTIVFTGKISRPRHEFEALVRQHGGTPGSSVSKNTNYLVVGEKPGSKLAVAAALGIPTITEEVFLSLLQPPNPLDDEVPLTPDELSLINSHIVTLTCSNCKREYRQWDTLPDRETCSVCELLLPIPPCPHCNSNNPTYVEDFDLYTCMSCGTWFKASHSIHARHTKHLCFFQQTKQTRDGVYKTCLGCGNQIFLSNNDLTDIKLKYEKAPILVRQWKEEAEEQEKRREAIKQESEKEVEALRFVESLSEEQIDQLKEALNVETR